MSRLLVVLLALTGLAFVTSTEAQAATRRPVVLTIHASAVTVNDGDPVTIRGRARHAVARTRVQLQHQVGGVWGAVATQRVSGTLRYAFTVTPPRGAQQYRAVTIRRKHQRVARSSAVDVAVTWQPTIGLTGSPVAHDDGTQWLRLSGVVTDGPGAPVVDLQSRTLDNATWSTIRTFNPGDGTPFTDDEPRSNHRMYRAVLHSSTYTPEVQSDVVNSESAPFVLTLGHQAALLGLPQGTDVATVDLDLVQGQRVTVTIERGSFDWRAKVQAPDLSTIGFLSTTCPCGGNPSLRFTAPLTGTYQIHISTDSFIVGDLVLAASVPVHLGLDQDGPAQAYSSQLAGQEVEASFHADAGDAFTVVDPDSKAPDFASEALIAPDGTTVDPLLRRDDQRHYAPVYLAQQSGTYTYRYTPVFTVGTGAIQVVHVPQATAAVDGDPVTVQVTAPGHVSLVWSDLDPGDVVSVTADSFVPVQSLRASAFGGWIDDIPGTTGRHLVVVRCCTTDQTGPVTVRAASPIELTTDIDGAPASFDLTGWRVRAVDVTFTGTAGEAVERVASTSSNLDTTYLYDANGGQVPELASEAYILPADGTYVFRTYVNAVGPGTVSVRSVPIVDVPTDGTPSTLNLVHGDGVALGRITAPPGTPIDATLSDVDAGLGTSWVVLILSSSSGQIDHWTEALLTGNTPPDTRPTFTVPDDGIVYFVLYSTNLTTGSVKVSAVVHPS